MVFSLKLKLRSIKKEKDMIALETHLFNLYQDTSN